MRSPGVPTATSTPVWPPGPLRGVVAKYLKVLVIVAVATLIRYWLTPIVGRSSFSVTLIAALLAAWAGGLPVTLLAQTAFLVIEVVLFADDQPRPPGGGVRALLGVGAFYF